MGHYGVVWECWDERRSELVVKVLLPEMGTATGCMTDQQHPKSLFQHCEKVATDQLVKINQAGDIAEGVGGYVAAQVARGWVAAVGLQRGGGETHYDAIQRLSAQRTELAVGAAQTCRNITEFPPMRSLSYVIEP